MSKTSFLVNYKGSRIHVNLNMSDLLADVIDWKIGGIADPVGQLGNWIVSTIGTYINSAVNNISGAVQRIVNEVIQGTNNLLGSVSSTLSNVYGIVSNLPANINNILNNLSGTISRIVQGISSAVSSSISSMSSTISSYFSSITNSLSSGFSSISRTVSSITSTVQSIISSSLGQLSSVIGSISATLSSAMSSLGGSLERAITSTISSISQTISGISSTLSSFANQIGAGLTSGLNQLGSILSASAAQLSASINSAFNSTLSGITGAFSGFAQSVSTQFKNIVDYFNQLNLGKVITDGFGKVSDFFNSLDLGGQVVKSIETGLSDFMNFFNNLNIGGVITNAFKPVLDFFSHLDIGKMISDEFAIIQKWFNDNVVQPVENWFSQFKLPDFSNLFNFVKAFGSDPLAAIKEAVGLPSELLAFLTEATEAIAQLTERHSPSILDNIGTFFNWFATAVSSTGLLGSLLQSEGIQALASGQPISSKISTDLSFFKPLTDWLQNLGANILGGLQNFAKAVSDGFNSLANYAVDGLISTFKMPTPSKTITDPFGKLFSSFFQSFQNMATSAQTQTPVTTDLIMSVVDGVSGAVIGSEALEYLGLAIDTAHPTKSLQLKDKFKQFFDKIGLGHVTGIIGASLVAASLSPLFSRFWNKQSQVQLLDNGTLLEMENRNMITPTNLDIYLQEHGFDSTFRDGIRETFLQIPDFDQIARAYLRFRNDGTITQANVDKELPAYLQFFHLKDKVRTGFSLSELQIAQRMIYRGVSRYERRALNSVGLLDVKTATNSISADMVDPALVPLMVKAERLQGSATWRAQIASAIASRVKAGYALATDFSTTLLTNEYTQTAIDYLSQANAYGLQTTIDKARLAELDKNYAEAVTDLNTYTTGVNDVILNTDVAKEHIAITQLARDRLDEARVRNEGHLAISYDLSAFAQGSISDDEFKTLAASMGKKPDEIDILVKARNILLANKTRTVKFAALQYLLAKRQITSNQFVAHATLLPYDPQLIQATADKVVAQALAKAKATPAVANEAVFNSYPSLMTSKTTTGAIVT